MKKILFLLLLLPLFGGGLLSAQNTIDVSGLTVEAGTVTFNVKWSDPGAPNLWSDTVWVFVDYNKNGKMERLLLTGGTLTAHSGTGEFIPENTMGAWVAGDARTNSPFSATVQLFTGETTVAGACAYASSYPPVGQYVSESEIIFSGTPMYEITLVHEDGVTFETIESGSTFLLPCSYTVSSFTDATGAPGITKCLAPANLTLTASPETICAGATVTLTASATGAASYSIDGSEWKVSPVFEVTPASNESYTLYAKTEEGCVTSVADAAVVMVNQPGAEGEAPTVCGCASELIECSGNCTTPHDTEVPGNCNGNCHQRNVTYWTVCGVQTGSGTVTDNTCTLSTEPTLHGTCYSNYAVIPIGRVVSMEDCLAYAKARAMANCATRYNGSDSPTNNYLSCYAYYCY
jgi:hypothetical protein